MPIALDPLRFDICSYRKLEYLPMQPGWIEDSAVIYLMPSCQSFKRDEVAAKPYVLRVSNNWLGMEVGAAVMGAMTPMLADLIDGMQTHEVALATKAALRALNKAFYLIDLEAAFLHLVYAVDALCHSKRLTGGRQRVWVAAFTSRGNANTFAKQLGGYDTHYGYRNKLVHEGRSFAAIGVKGEDACQFMHDVLASCIRTFLLEGFATRQDAASYAYALLQLPAYQPAMAALATKNFRLPIVGDARFIEHMTP